MTQMTKKMSKTKKTKRSDNDEERDERLRKQWIRKFGQKEMILYSQKKRDDDVVTDVNV